MNLGPATINAFYLPDLPFRMVGLDARPGDTLTPGYYDGRMKFELYWRLQSGDVHSAVVDLASILPSSFAGDVVVSIHDDHVNVSWAKIAEEWVEYSRIGDPREFPRPSTPYFAGCDGVIFDDPLSTAAWTEKVDQLRREARTPEEVETKVAESRCNLEWYFPTPSPERSRPQIDEKTARQLREEWLAQIELHKQQHKLEGR
jgi:hypothetical protein